MRNAVLIIDDDRSVARSLAAMLDKLGLHETFLSHNPIEALSLVSANPERFKAIFVDLHMPELDGLELIHRLEALNYQGGIIILSGLETNIVQFAEDVIKSTKLKLLGACEKPLRLDVLAFLVKRIRYLENRTFTKAPSIKKRDLEMAIHQGRIVPYFQPKISHDFSTLIGAEALIRLENERRERLLPDEFLPVALKFNLVDDLFQSLLDTTIGPYLDFLRSYKVECPLSINVFPEQLLSDNFYSQIRAALDQHGFPPELLTLEITEHQTLNSAVQMKNFNRLKILGCKLSLDDFGTGFTNLGQIRRMPFDEVKLDMQMVSGVAHDPILEVICRSTLAVTKAMNITLIAEGIDNEEDLKALEKIGVDGYQGYLIGKPKPLEEFIRWYSVWAAVAKDEAQLF